MSLLPGIDQDPARLVGLAVFQLLEQLRRKMTGLLLGQLEFLSPVKAQRAERKFVLILQHAIHPARRRSG
jgi:hypothetical protein